MSEIWFTSDTHFDHKNILEYEKVSRPFDNVQEMNDVLINNWNNTVGKKDTVYHLGDFAFSRSGVGYASRLNGRKKLILGNHDVYGAGIYLGHFEKLFGLLYWRRCILSHIPVHPGSLGSRAFLNVHGHLHSNKVMLSGSDAFSIMTDSGPMLMSGVFDQDTIEDLNYFNVSVECHDLKPVNSSVIMQRLKEIE